MSLQANRFIKAMSLLSGYSARKDEFIAAGLLAFFASVLHQRAPDSEPLMTWRDGHIFDNAGTSTTLCQVIHDEQFIGADDLAIELRYEHTVVRIPVKHREMFAAFLRSERAHGFESCIAIDSQNLGDVIDGGLADEGPCHTERISYDVLGTGATFCTMCSSRCRRPA